MEPNDLYKNVDSGNGADNANLQSEPISVETQTEQQPEMIDEQAVQPIPSEPAVEPRIEPVAPVEPETPTLVQEIDPLVDKILGHIGSRGSQFGSDAALPPVADSTYHILDLIQSRKRQESNAVQEVVPPPIQDPAPIPAPVPAPVPEPVPAPDPNRRTTSVLDDILARKGAAPVVNPTLNPTQQTQPLYDPARLAVTGDIYKNNPNKGKQITGPVRMQGNPNYTMRDIGQIVQRINKGQKELSKLQRYENSSVMRALYDVGNLVSGNKQPMKTVYQLFQGQQRNVEELNFGLATLAKGYGQEAGDIRKTLDWTIEMNEREYQRLNELKGKLLSPEVQNYQTLQQSFDGMTRENPEYYATLKSLIGARRNVRRLTAENMIVGHVDEHHSKDIENLMLQEEIFETLLSSIVDMAYTTKLYQDTLNNNASIWESTDTLKQALVYVAGGINMLANYNKMLNDRYIRSVQEITNIINANPASQQVELTNSELRRLAEDISNGVYKEQLKYLDRGE
jgi:hypothetical protein